MRTIKRTGITFGVLGIVGSSVFPVLTNLMDYRVDFSVGGWLSMMLCLVGIACLAWVSIKKRKKT